ncbi:S39AD protein, partial [Amia calva]|nr:S39AD protein [Amia calva]
IRMRTLRPSFNLLVCLCVAALLFVSSGASSHRANTKKMSQATAVQAAGGSWGWSTEDLLGFGGFAELFVGERADAWFCSLIGSLMVGLSGVFPLLVIPIEAGAALKTDAGCQKLKRLLSFAIGGLLGDVFLHLLPEAWAYSCSSAGTDGKSSRHRHQLLGLWVITGLLSFLIVEKMFPDRESQDDAKRESQCPPGCPDAELSLHRGACCGLISCPQDKSSSPVANGHCCHSSHSTLKPKITRHQPDNKIKTSGYLNLVANCIDNFTHGLAVAGSFLVSRKVGFLTTLAILLHEIPHEVGDFAILLRAGFDRWSAAKMQLYTALGGVLGACFALCAQSPKGAENAASWILPFTSGGFLYIALVNVVPDLLQETNPRYLRDVGMKLYCGSLITNPL